MVKTIDCGSIMRGFESRRSPLFSYSMLPYYSFIRIVGLLMIDKKLLSGYIVGMGSPSCYAWESKKTNHFSYP